MKKFILLIYFVPLGILSQNLIDAYDVHDNDYYFHPSDKIVDFYGEYQIFLDKLFWQMDTRYEDAAKSLSIQAVSFPFIPKALSHNDINSSNMHNETSRVFGVQNMNGYNHGYLEQTGNNYSYKGLGWQYGNWKIYSKIENTYTFASGNNFMCDGDYGLISAGFVEPIVYDNYDDCWLPHTILKHTIYFHCGTDITDPIIDSIWWIYDNTRGKMKTYPFADENGDLNLTLINNIVDVCFRPTFINGNILYGYINSNTSIYNSGVTDSTGSVNYFPAGEIHYQYNTCANYPLYHSPGNPDGAYQHSNLYGNSYYFVDFVHPPEYVLLDAPLLNSKGNTWAGYSSSAKPDTGILHKYEINDRIDLRLINPAEKIIYNPSYVYVNVDLVFPCEYKFLTLHGKYPDKEQEVLKYYNEYWAGKGLYFGYERDYPTPVNLLTNEEYLSTYEIKNGKTILIEPNVIIMNAYFKGEDGGGKSYLAYDPNRKLGNWEYDETSIEVIPLEYSEVDCDYFIPSQSEDSLKHSSLPVNEVSEPEIPNYAYLRVYNDGSNTIYCRSNSTSYINSKVQVYNSYGSLMLEKKNPNEDYHFSASDWTPGIYIAVLIVNGQKVNSRRFYVK
jgi:hypothetical protein